MRWPPWRGWWRRYPLPPTNTGGAQAACEAAELARQARARRPISRLVSDRMNATTNRDHLSEAIREALRSRPA